MTLGSEMKTQIRIKKEQWEQWEQVFNIHEHNLTFVVPPNLFLQNFGKFLKNIFCQSI